MLESQSPASATARHGSVERHCNGAREPEGQPEDSHDEALQRHREQRQGRQQRRMSPATGRRCARCAPYLARANHGEDGDERQRCDQSANARAAPGNLRHQHDNRNPTARRVGSDRSQGNSALSRGLLHDVHSSYVNLSRQTSRSSSARCRIGFYSAERSSRTSARDARASRGCRRKTLGRPRDLRCDLNAAVAKIVTFLSPAERREDLVKACHRGTDRPSPTACHSTSGLFRR